MHHRSSMKHGMTGENEPDGQYPTLHVPRAHGASCAVTVLRYIMGLYVFTANTNTRHIIGPNKLNP